MKQDYFCIGDIAILREEAITFVNKRMKRSLEYNSHGCNVKNCKIGNIL